MEQVLTSALVVFRIRIAAPAPLLSRHFAQLIFGGSGDEGDFLIELENFYSFNDITKKQTS